ncbi:MAG: hypothetical protein PF436_09690 [Prolixibacteraceae bacterium]|nr:hypothetical protein [Prolixibacteraceae bacterium]
MALSCRLTGLNPLEQYWKPPPPVAGIGAASFCVVHGAKDTAESPVADVLWVARCLTVLKQRLENTAATNKLRRAATQVKIGVKKPGIATGLASIVGMIVYTNRFRLASSVRSM